MKKERKAKKRNGGTEVAPSQDIASITIGVIYIYGLLSKLLFGSRVTSNTKKNKSGKKIEYKDVDFKEVD